MEGRGIWCAFILSFLCREKKRKEKDLYRWPLFNLLYLCLKDLLTLGLCFPRHLKLCIGTTSLWCFLEDDIHNLRALVNLWACHNNTDNWRSIITRLFRKWGKSSTFITFCIALSDMSALKLREEFYPRPRSFSGKMQHVWLYLAKYGRRCPSLALDNVYHGLLLSQGIAYLIVCCKRRSSRCGTTRTVSDGTCHWCWFLSGESCYIC